MHLFVHVGPLLDSLGASTDIDDALAFDTITMGECVFEPLGPARVRATLSNTGAGIVVAGTAEVSVRTSCVRCLRDFEMDATGEVEGFYVLPGHDEGLPGEQEFDYIAEGRIDLASAVLQAIVVDLPFAPVHSDTCTGLCPVCGADRNDAPCSCAPVDADSPFAALRPLTEGSGEHGES